MHQRKSKKILLYFFLLIILGTINNHFLNRLDIIKLKNIKTLLSKNIHQGDNPADIILKDEDNNLIPFSIKYMKTFLIVII